MKKALYAIIVSIFFLFSVMSAHAQDTSDGKDWSFTLAPLYFWGVSITGDMTVKGIESEVDADFSDIWDNLNGIFTVHLDAAWKETWGGFIDINWLNLESDGTTPPGGTVTSKITSIITEFAGFYRLNKDAHRLDLLAGGRYTEMDTKLEFSGPLGIRKGNESWVDPMFGLRWIWKFADN